MKAPSFESYSQNGEDVVLWRALGNVHHGRYIDVGAYHPVDDSVTMAFYKAGWHGITVEPDPHNARLHREQRPRDVQVEAAITVKDADSATLHLVDNTGLSTLSDTLADTHINSGYASHDVAVVTRRLDRILEEVGWKDQEIHFMTVDTEGSERSVLESIDFSSWRPWVLVIEATEPNSTRPTRSLWEDVVIDAGYRFCLFDGLSCFYVAEEHADLSPALSYPACVLDDYTTPAFRHVAKRAEMIPSLIADAARWRTESVTRWANAVGKVQDLQERIDDLQSENASLRREIDALRKWIDEFRTSTSWRLTKPIRALKSLVSRSG